jgi:hypothetical protein
MVNVRSFALVGILLALQTDSPLGRGAGMAAARLFSQYAFLAVPAVAYDVVYEYSLQRAKGWLIRFVVALMGIVVLSFGVVAVVWSPAAAVAGFELSFGSVSGYVTKQGGGDDPLSPRQSRALGRVHL